MGFFDGCTGKPEDAFAPDFSVIPNGTTARAVIKTINMVDEATQYGPQKHFQVIWELLDGEFKDREVKQNIKCFIGNDNVVRLGRNMLLLLLTLCGHKLAHDNEPTVFDLLPLINKQLGIKIRETEGSILGKDGCPKFYNSVSELHPLDDKFITVTGIKLQPKSGKRGSSQQQDIPNIADNLDGSIPF